MAEKYDLIIVGAGAAGLSAGLFATRRGLSTLILSKDMGGQASTTPEIENYPGLDLVEGWDLMAKFVKQYKQFGGDVRYEEVSKIEQDGELFTVTTPHHAHTAEAVILAFGKTPNDLGVEGEEKFKGSHVHYAAMRDVSMYKDKTVAMVGGANTAAQGAITLAEVAKKVYLFCREDKMRAEKVLLDRLLERSDLVEIIYNSTVQEFVGADSLEHMKVLVEGKEKDYDVDDCFIGVGYSNKTEWIKHLAATDKIGQIIIQTDCSTSTTGLFAAGDVTTIPYKQVVISAGEGAKAAIAVSSYLAKKRGSVSLSIDWGLRVSAGQAGKNP